MKHTRTISKHHRPAMALSLLQLQQVITTFGTFATGVSVLTGGLGAAFGAYTTGLERAVNIYEDKKGEQPPVA
ncbi:MAG: hypothetical protein SGI88_11630 [Candidatus Hydrogenedentes bacterium]|nr:hypothetical protein [Candidatus Hydrogenedentota bacterium]